MAETINVKFNVDATGAEKIAQIPKEAVQHFERLNQVMGQGMFSGPQGDLLKSLSQRMEDISQTAAGQGFFTPKLRREFESGISEISRLVKRYYDEQISAAKEGASRLEKELADIDDRRRAARGKEKEDLTKEFAAKYQEYEKVKREGVDTSSLEAEQAQTLREAQDLRAMGRLSPMQQPAKEEQQQGGGAGVAVLSGLARGLGGGMGLGIAALAYQFGARVRRDFSSELERSIAVGDMAQRLQPIGMPDDQFREASRRLQETLNPTESTRFYGAYGGLAGAGTGPGEAKRAVDITRGYGFDPDEGAQMFGQVGRQGVDLDRLSERIGEGIGRGRMQGREREMWESVIQMSDALTQRVGRAPAEGIADLLGKLASSDVPGLKGSYGAAALTGMDEAFRSIQLFNMPNMGQIAALQMFSEMGITDPAKMRQIQEGGLLAHPEIIPHVFQSIEHWGGINNPIGQQVATAFGVSIQPEVYEGEKMLKGPNGPGFLDFFKRMLPEDQYKGLDLAKTPRLFGVAAEFQGREEAGEFTSEDDERKQLVAALEKEKLVMADEMGTRLALVTAKQAEAAAVDKLVAGFTVLVNDTLPRFGHVMNDVADKLTNLFGFSKETMKTSPEMEKYLWSLPPDQRENMLTYYGDAEAERLRKEFATGQPEGKDFRTGQHLGSSAVTPGRARYSMTDTQKKIFDEVSAKYNLDEGKFIAWIGGENAFTHKVSSVGARGVAQIMPGNRGPFPKMTLAQLDADPTSIDAGGNYARQMLNRYGEDYEVAESAYEIGPADVPRGAKIEDVLRRQDEKSMREKGIMSEAHRLLDRSHAIMKGEATVWIKSAETGETLGKVDVHMHPTEKVTGLASSSAGVGGIH